MKYNKENSTTSIKGSLPSPPLPEESNKVVSEAEAGIPVI